MSRGLSVAAIGRLAAIASATSFAGVSMFAGFVYSGGATPASVIAARLLFGLVGTFAVVAYLRRPWMVPAREWRPTLVIAGAWLAVNVCYMASFYYIPVSLAVLIFFTFPVQVALIGPLLARRRPEPVTLGAALIAFAGLALALGPDLGDLDWRGCALALAAAVALMTTFLMSRRLVVDQDMFTFSFNLHLLCGLAVVAWVGGTGGIALPAAPVAIAALFGVGVFYILAVCLQFFAIRSAGAPQSSIMFNAEPVFTVLGAALLLGEHLGMGQVAGAVLVIVGVLLSTRAKS
ncbi:MAG: DMT family transporter [Halofilum sp. (in: g-proteobacteria)]|nr:DMT family transporter [Halofilum sp. (in: g-proteobacteria)]